MHIRASRDTRPDGGGDRIHRDLARPPEVQTLRLGVATDDGVVMGTYLDQSFKRNKPTSLAAVQDAVIEAGQRRIKPAVMTSATTIIALLPILTSTGRGADIMIPMAIPSFGGMLIALITLFVVPVLYSWKQELQLKNN